METMKSPTLTSRHVDTGRRRSEFTKSPCSFACNGNQTRTNYYKLHWTGMSDTQLETISISGSRPPYKKPVWVIGQVGDEGKRRRAQTAPGTRQGKLSSRNRRPKWVVPYLPTICGFHLAKLGAQLAERFVFTCGLIRLSKHRIAAVVTPKAFTRQLAKVTRYIRRCTGRINAPTNQMIRRWTVFRQYCVPMNNLSANSWGQLLKNNF